MSSAHRVDYGRFVPFAYPACKKPGTLVPLLHQIVEKLPSSFRLMTAEAADKICSPQPISPGSQPKLQGDELISPEEILRKFIESY